MDALQTHCDYNIWVLEENNLCIPVIVLSSSSVRKVLPSAFTLLHLGFKVVKAETGSSPQWTFYSLILWLSSLTLTSCKINWFSTLVSDHYLWEISIFNHTLLDLFLEQVKWHLCWRDLKREWGFFLPEA